MVDDRHSDQTPERPRFEAEIIPPGVESRRPVHGWNSFENRAGVHRIYVTRPGLPSILLGLIIVGAIVALSFFVLAGVLLLALPLAAAGILLALFYGPVRYHWRRLLDRLGGWR